MGIKNKAKNFVKKCCYKKTYIPIPQPINVQNILEGKVAMITGGSGGIGFAIAKSFVNSGCKVILCGTNEQKLKDNCDKLQSNDAVRYLILDVTDIATFEDKIEQAAHLFGGIDILVNAAGVIAKMKFFDTTEEEYDSVMDINTKGTYFMCQAMAKFMIKNKIHGHILNVSSSSALRPAWTPYPMSKWAVRGFTMGLADTLLPYGIIVNAIAPGPTATPMLWKSEGDSIEKPGNPSGRYAMPSEIASLATFMVSDLGNLIVGDTFYITGGSGVISYHE